MRTLQTPHLSADIIIEMIDRPERPIILIERKNPPHGWAIPGGFVDLGERLEDAAVREALEETQLNVTLQALLGIYSKPGRDPRFHTVTAVYVAHAQGEPKAADDAKNLQMITMEDIPKKLAFDHDQVLEDYLNFRNYGTVTPLRVNES